MDSIFDPDIDITDLRESILRERITKDLKKRLIECQKQVKIACDNLEKARSEVFELAPNDRCIAWTLINEIESEAL